MGEIRKITVEIDADIFNDIKQEVGFKIMTDNMYGPCDELLLVLIKSIDAKKSKVRIIKRKKGQKRMKI